MDYAGKSHEFLTILRLSEKSSHILGANLWDVQCVCGKIFQLETSKITAILRGDKKTQRSCGCMRYNLIKEKVKTHGMSKHPLYGVYRSMVDRCRLPTHQAWQNYGGRGITVCERWSQGFEFFWEDMGITYQPGLDLDRIDNNAGYNKDNCRWVDRTTNCRNKRNSVYIETPKGERPLPQVVKEYGIGATTLLYRLNNGCPKERLLDPPKFSNRYSTWSTADQIEDSQLLMNEEKKS